MAEALIEAPVLGYAEGTRAPVSARGWRVLLWVGAVHWAVVLMLAGVSSRSMLPLLDMVRDAPRDDWFLQAMAAQVVGFHVMMLANGLAVAGYWSACRRRVPRAWFMAYVPIQLALMALTLGLTVTMAAASPHQLTPSSTIGTSYFAVLILPVAFAVVNLPLTLLLLPRVRRGCFAR